MPSRVIMVEEVERGLDFSRYEAISREAKPGMGRHLILGIDVARFAGSIEGIVQELEDFRKIVKGADPHAFAATVFVLDEVGADRSRLDDKDVDRLVEAGV
jgi:hypothetical protein